MKIRVRWFDLIAVLSTAVLFGIFFYTLMNGYSL